MEIQIDHINKSEALRYMGYGINKPDENTMNSINEVEKELLKVIVPQYTFRVFDIDVSINGVAVPGTSLVLTGKDITQHLKNCTKAALLAATVSQGADRLIRTYAAYDMAKSVIADCLSSAAVEQLCNKIDVIIKENSGMKYQTWRFSPGYGDLPLEIQRDFLNILDAPKRIGLSVLDNYMMVPTKSVTAVIGLSDEPIQKGKTGCACCNMRETCKYRIRGEHCGV